MYNDWMATKTFQIRVCTACGLRYPLTDGHDFGTRCPSCMGETRLLLSRELVFEPKPSRSVADLSLLPSPARSGVCAVLLDNIRSAWNVGSILRSADGFAFSHAYLCGITPTPDHAAVTKTSLGAEDSVTWSYHKDALKLMEELKKEGWCIWALEADERATSIQSMSAPGPNQPIVLVLGSEVTGIDPALLDHCDEIFFIPMRGEKKSFNVAMAFSIAAYQMQK
jgi:tRNA G18 (ribose-2'-O)-methylase SpoU